jgi:hypothetical protein
MTTFIVIYHSGVIITNDIGSYEFVKMIHHRSLFSDVSG